MITEEWKQFTGSGCIDLNDLPWEVVTCGTKTKSITVGTEDTGRVTEFVRVKLPNRSAPVVASEENRTD
jgi:hypothetical protein